MTTTRKRIIQSLSAACLISVAIPAYGESCSLPLTWEDGIVYFEFASDFTGSEKEWVRRAMDKWSKTNVDVVFLPLNGLTNKKHIYITDDNDGNYHEGVGAPPSTYPLFDESELHVDTHGWDNQYFPVHEIGHALGFWHEMQRSDRDSHIVVNYENMASEHYDQYDVVRDSCWLYHRLTFGFQKKSIMNYNQCFKSTCIDGCPTALCSPDGGRTIVPADKLFPWDNWGPAAFRDNNFELRSFDVNRGVAVYGSGTVRYLDNNSGDASNGTLEEPYTALGHAVNNSPSGSRVYMKGSTYTPSTPITLDRKLTWRAYPNETATIR